MSDADVLDAERGELLTEQRAQIESLKGAVAALEQKLAQRDEFTSTNPKGPHVAFLTPAYDGLKPSYVKSLLGSMRLLAREGFRTSQTFSWGCSIISNARTELFGEAMRATADVLVMVDSDIGWDPVDLLTMILFEEPVSVLPIPVRSVDLETMIDRDRKAEGITFNVWPSPDAIADRPKRGGGRFACVDGAGGAFTVMKRDAALAMVRHYGELAVKVGKTELASWALWHPIVQDGTEWGEDTSFFWRWHAIGGETWALLDGVASHAGELVLSARLADKWHAADVTSLSTTRYGP